MIAKRVDRVGSTVPETSARESLASVRLEGIEPDERAHLIVLAVAKGQMTIDEAVEIMRSWYSEPNV